MEKCIFLPLAFCFIGPFNNKNNQDCPLKERRLTFYYTFQFYSYFSKPYTCQYGFLILSIFSFAFICLVLRLASEELIVVVKVCIGVSVFRI